MSGRYESLGGEHHAEGPEAMGSTERAGQGEPASRQEPEAQPVATGTPTTAGRLGDSTGPGDETKAEPLAADIEGDLSGLEQLLSDDFARISAERDEYLDSLKRLQADFDNFRKRVNRQQSELRTRASEALLVRLLPVLDSLDLAIAHLGLAEKAGPDEAATSLLQINAQLQDIVRREGLERIDEVGVLFDPTIHEATDLVDKVENTTDGHAGRPVTIGGAVDDSAQPGPRVSEVWRSGYRLGERVLRPAMVRVSA